MEKEVSFQTYFFNKYKSFAFDCEENKRLYESLNRLYIQIDHYKLMITLNKEDTVLQERKKD